MTLIAFLLLLCGGPVDIFVTDKEYEAYKRREDAKPRFVHIEGGYIVRRYMRGLGWYHVFIKTTKTQKF